MVNSGGKMREALKTKVMIEGGRGMSLRYLDDAEIGAMK